MNLKISIALLLPLIAQVSAGEVTITDAGRVRIASGEELGTVASAIANAVAAEARGQKPLATPREIQNALEAWLGKLRTDQAAAIAAANAQMEAIAPFVEAAKTERQKQRDALKAVIKAKQEELAKIKD